MVNMNSIVFDTDSYKVSMWQQYPSGTENVYSYVMARGGIFDATVVVGIQVFRNEVLEVPVRMEDVLAANEYWTAHGEPFNLAGWTRLVEKHNGILPLLVKCVPEGSVVPTGNVLVTVENTDPEFPWITTWVETSLLRTIWYMSSVATLSREIKKVIKSYLEKSGDVSSLSFKLHDFGSRSVGSGQGAARGSLSHLTNFSGTDTFIGVLLANKVYGADIKNTGFSIPAAEHSTITSWGRSNEAQAYANMVDKFSKPGSIYAVVSDSYDIYAACEMWGTTLKDRVINSGGTLVIRPDSGEPTEVLPKMFNILGKHFGWTYNDKGYAVLNNVRVIWGDGINLQSIKRILAVLVDDYGYSADNIAFGMGGALLNRIQRDDLGWAMKCSAIRVNGVWRDVSKNPITAPGKSSMAGRVVLYKKNGEFYTGVEDWDMGSIYLNTVFDGKSVGYTRFVDIRANAEIGL